MSILTGDEITVISHDKYHNITQSFFTEGKMTEIVTRLTVALMIMDQHIHQKHRI